MAIKTRQTTATGVTNNNAPLTNDELDNNFVELVAEDATKADLSGATFTGDVVIDNNSTSGALKIQSGDNLTGASNRVAMAFGFNETNDYQHFIQTRHNSAAYVGNAIDIKLCDSTQNNTWVSGSQYALSLDGGDLSLYDNSNNVKFFWDSSAERLGIGTSAPSDKLEVKGATAAGVVVISSGDTTLTGNDVIGQLNFKDYDADAHVGGDQDDVVNIKAIALHESGGAAAFDGSANEGYALSFSTSKRPSANAAFTVSEAMRLDSSGNLGIGTGSSISSDLHIHRTSAGASQFRITDSSTGTGASDGLVIGLDSNTDAYFWNYENADVYFGTNNSTRMRINESGKTTIVASAAPYDHAWLNIGSTGSGETRAIDIDGSWVAGENKSITFNYGTNASNIVAQINAIYDDPNSSLRFGKFYNDGDTTSYPMVLSGTGSTTADLKLNGRLLNSQGARLHNEPASGLRGTGMNMTSLGAIDTGNLVQTTGCRGIVWTGKHYIVVDATDANATFQFLDSDLSVGRFKNNSSTIDHNESDLFGPHGAAWDGRYIAVIGRNTSGGYNNQLHIFDLDNLTSGYATRIAKIDLSSIVGVTNNYGVGYAEGLYWVRNGTNLWGVEVDLASQTATAVVTKTGLASFTAQGITYDGSHLYMTANGASMYKHFLGGDLVASINTGNIPNCTALTWNGQEFIGVDYSTRKIYAIPVTHESYSEHYIKGNRVLTTEDDSRFVDQEEVSATVPAVGWYRVAQSSGSAGRGDFDITVFTTGGNYTPQSVHIRGHKTWTNDGIITSAESSGGYWNAARITTDGTNSWLEVYFTSSILSSQLRIEQRGIAYNRFSPLSGTLSAGGDTVIDTLDNLSTGFNSKYLHAQSSGYVGAAYDYRSNTRWFINNASNTTPATSGTTQNCPLRIRGGDNAMLDFGVNGGSGAWIQATNATSLNLVYPLLLNQNGGNVGINTTAPFSTLHITGSTAQQSNNNLLMFHDDLATASNTSVARSHFIGRIDNSGYHMTTGAGGFAGVAGALGIGAHGSIQFGTCEATEAYASGRMLIDTDGNVGIGTNAPSSPLTISHTNLSAEPYSGLKIINTAPASGAAYTGVYVDAPLQSHIRLATAGSLKWQMRTGTTTSGELRFYSWDGAADVFTLASNGNATLTGELTVNSDERIKDNIKQIDGALEKVQAIRGVTFTRNDTEDDRTHVGVIAQEVEKVLPEVVTESEETGIKSVAYANMVGLLIEAIKEQQTQIDDLKAEVTRLKGFE